MFYNTSFIKSQQYSRNCKEFLNKKCSIKFNICQKITDYSTKYQILPEQWIVKQSRMLNILEYFKIFQNIVEYSNKLQNY